MTTVTYVSNKGLFEEQTIEVPESGVVVLWNPEYAETTGHYRCEGWYLNGVKIGEPGVSLTVTQDLTLTSNDEQYYIVTFVPTKTGAYEPQIVYVSEFAHSITLIDPPYPEKIDARSWYCMGWYSSGIYMGLPGETLDVYSDITFASDDKYGIKISIQTKGFGNIEIDPADTSSVVVYEGDVVSWTVSGRQLIIDDMLQHVVYTAVDGDGIFNKWDLDEPEGVFKEDGEVYAIFTNSVVVTLVTSPNDSGDIYIDDDPNPYDKYVFNSISGVKFRLKRENEENVVLVFDIGENQTLEVRNDPSEDKEFVFWSMNSLSGDSIQINEGVEYELSYDMSAITFTCFFSVVESETYPIVFCEADGTPIMKDMMNVDKEYAWDVKHLGQLTPTEFDWQPYQSSGIIYSNTTKSVRLKKIINVYYKVAAPVREEHEDMRMIMVCGEYGALDLGEIQSITDTYTSQLTTIPIVAYGYSRSFCMDTGVSRTISVNYRRVSPEKPRDDATDSRMWSNGKWVAKLKEFVDRWQMRTNGVRLYQFLPGDLSITGNMDECYPEINPNPDPGKVLDSKNWVNAFVTSINPSYSTDSVHLQTGTISFTIGTIYPKPTAMNLVTVFMTMVNGKGERIRSKYMLHFPNHAYSALPSCPSDFVEEFKDMKYTFWKWRFFDSEGKEIEGYPGEPFKVYKDEMEIEAVGIDISNGTFYENVDKPKYVQVAQGQTLIVILVGGGGGGGHSGGGRTANVELVTVAASGGGGGGSANAATRVFNFEESGGVAEIIIGKGGTSGKNGDYSVFKFYPGAVLEGGVLTEEMKEDHPIDPDYTFRGPSGKAGKSGNLKDSYTNVGTAEPGAGGNGYKKGGNGGAANGGGFLKSPWSNDGSDAEHDDGEVGYGKKGYARNISVRGTILITVEYWAYSGGGGGGGAPPNVGYLESGDPVDGYGGNGGTEGDGKAGYRGGGGGGGAPGLGTDILPAGAKVIQKSGGRGGNGYAYYVFYNEIIKVRR